MCGVVYRAFPGACQACHNRGEPSFRSTRFAEGALWVDPTGYGVERLTISR